MSDIVNDTFVGAHAEAANGGQPIPLDPLGEHWAQGTTSGGQVAVMTPVLLDGTRREFTPLDFAGLADIGWQVQGAAPAIQFSQPDYSVSESGGSIMIPVTRTGDASGAISVQVSTSNGSAKVGVDYTAVSQTLDWADGDSSTQDVLIPIIDNVHASGDLTVNLNLGDPTGGALLGDPDTATLTITLGDAVVQFADAQYPANISAGVAQIVVTRSGDLGGTVSATLSSPGGNDVAAFQEMVTFGPDATSTTVRVPLQNDGQPGEPDAAIPLALSLPSSAQTLAQR